MKIKGRDILLSVTAILILVSSSMVFGQEAEKMKMDEYKLQLAEWQTRQTDANSKQAQLQADIEALKQEIAGTQAQIDAEWEAIFALLGTDKAAYDAFNADLDGLDAQMDGLAALSPEELFRAKEDVVAIEAKIAEAKASKFYIISDVEEKVAALEAKLASLKAKMPANIFDQYTVEKGDYLWKISKKDEIYGDPLQWIRIYCVNKDQIKNPDLIYSEQVLNIARGVGMNEHLVAKGEWLSKIAGYANVMNDPAAWTKLYEANKDIVTDPSLIYPYQVLTIPKE